MNDTCFFLTHCFLDFFFPRCIYPKNDSEDDSKKNPIPETRVGDEGTAKRNIQRRHDHDPNRKPKPQHGGGVGGKSQWNEIDDGTLP
jgi:hypothetical protein